MEGQKKPVVAILGVLLAVAVGVIIYLVASGGNKPVEPQPVDPTPTTVSVPNVVRLDQDDAKQLIINAGLTMGKVKSKYSNKVPEGHVISQDPAAKTSVEEGTAVDIVVSKGKKAPEKVTVPDLTGMTQEDAEKALANAKLVAVPGAPAYSDSVEPGKVCSQSVAAGTVLDEGSQVSFSISLGRETVVVPDVTGKNIDDARAALANAGLGVDTTTSYSDDVAKDVVISQSVAKDTKVVKGTVVSLEVSLGAKPKEKVTVPNIYTYTLDEAERALVSAGLKYRYTGDEDGTVVAMDPEAGTEVDQGSTVSFTLQHHITMVAVPNVSGLSGTDARAACDQVGLNLDYDTDDPDKAIDSTDPVAGTMVDVGSTVTAIYAPDPPDPPTPEPVSGAWEAYTGEKSKVSSDEKTVFSNAGADSAVPVAVVASQMVEGANYAFLGYDGSTWAIFNITVDPDGIATLQSKDAIDITNVSTTDASTNEYAGQWAASDAEAGKMSSKEAQNAFNTAADGWSGVSLTPIACLGTQIVDGTNYKILCAGSEVTPDAETQLYVVTVAADPSGDASFSDVSEFDLLAYIG